MSVEIIDRIATSSGCYATNVQQKAKPSSEQNSHYRKFYNTNPPFLVLHSLGCQRDSADVQADKWNNPNGQSIAHACVDARDGKTRQTLPWDFRGWHIGTDGNDIAIGVEMAESLSIKYKGGDKFDVLDLNKAKENCRIAYEGAVELFAYLCGTFGVDPLGKREINGKLFPEVMSHNEYNRIRGASGHTDPEHYWNGLNMGYTMDGFRNAVALKMNEIAQNDGDGIVGYLGFPDVEETDWYAPALKWAVEKKIVISDGGRFNPNNTISNAAFVVRLRRMYNALYADLKQELSAK